MDSVFSYLLENYGAVGLFLIIVGLIAWFIIKELKQSNQKLIETQNEMNESLQKSLTNSLSDMTTKLTESIQKQNDKLVDHIIANSNRKQEEHKENVIERIGITGEIKEKIKELTILTQATRGLVIEFHNSFENLSGFPFAKYTATYEYVTKGVIPIMQNINALQFSSISGVVERIYDKSNVDHIVIAHNAQELEEISPLMETFIRESSEAILWKGLFDSHNQMLIGLLALEFRNGLPERVDKVSIKMTATAIAELITLTKKV